MLDSSPRIIVNSSLMLPTHYSARGKNTRHYHLLCAQLRPKVVLRHCSFPLCKKAYLGCHGELPCLARARICVKVNLDEIPMVILFPPAPQGRWEWLCTTVKASVCWKALPTAIGTKLHWDQSILGSAHGWQVPVQEETGNHASVS